MVSTAQPDQVEPTRATNAQALRLEHKTVPVDQSVAGSPTTGFVALGSFGGLEVGVWEMTVGTMTDVEVDEVFVVIVGRATVTETLRKVYLA